MSEKGRANPFPALRAVIGLCLLGLVGCQSSLSYNILDGSMDHEPLLTMDKPIGAPAGTGQAIPNGPATDSQVSGLVNRICYTSPTSATPTMSAANAGIVQAGYSAPAPGPGMLPPAEPGGSRPIPHELDKVSLPLYVIEPPDILLIDTVRITPLPPYHVEPMDVLQVQVAEPLPNQPISGMFPVTPEGGINLGAPYGVVKIAGMTLDEAEAAVKKQLGRYLKNPQVSVTLAQTHGLQQTRGEHLVRPDGTIGLGTYGYVYVTGMTIPQAKEAIENHLSHFLLRPEISLDVFAYNSKVYYIITDGAGFGEQVYRMPITGNETVLDALSQIYGLPAVASRKRIWVARPAPACYSCDQVLPVDWKAITQGGSTGTNYQIFPGDRIYVKADCLIWIDNTLAKILAPVERIFGVTLLGTETVNAIRFSNNNNNGFFTPF
jgi:protein involved in polysaccharide export with SLBB domain